MKNVTESTEAGRQYATAYAAHHKGRDLAAALQLYMNIIELHSGDQESGYSRMQVQNIVNSVVPQQELLDTQVELALTHLGVESESDAKFIPVRPLASGLPI